jgi:hypothetical protein
VHNLGSLLYNPENSDSSATTQKETAQFGMTSSNIAELWVPAFQPCAVEPSDLIHAEFPVLGFSDFSSFARDTAVGNPRDMKHGPTTPAISEKSNSTTGSSSRSEEPFAEWSGEEGCSFLAQLITSSASGLLRVYIRSGHNLRQCATNQAKSSNTKEPRSESAQINQRLQTNPSHKCRARSDENASDDEEYPDGMKKDRKNVQGVPSNHTKPLACPFNKFDNRFFGPDSPDESYHICATCNFVTIAHLKYVPIFNLVFRLTLL